MEDSQLFLFGTARPFDPEVEEWLSGEPHTLFLIARTWFNAMRACGDDVTELIHDDCPVACVGQAAFAYVNVFKAHVNVGFFTGAFLDDADNILEGTGKRMRHVKLRPEMEFDKAALSRLVRRAYADVKSKLD